MGSFSLDGWSAGTTDAYRKTLSAYFCCVVLASCTSSSNSTIGTWVGNHTDLGTTAKFTITISEKNGTVYDARGIAVGSFPVTFTAKNEAVITYAFGAVDVTVLPDGSARVAGLGVTTSSHGDVRSVDTAHRIDR